MVLIFAMSTDLGSASNTSLFVEPFLRWLFPSASHGTIQEIHFYIRKSAHLGEYAILGVLFWRALRHTISSDARRSQWKVAVVALLLSATYAATDEFHQSFVPSRSASVRDVMIDTVGTFIGLCVVEAGSAIRRRTDV